MTDGIESLARRLVEGTHDYTSGRARKRVDVERIIRRLALAETSGVASAIRFAEAMGWIAVEDEHTICLTEAGCEIVTAT